MTENMRNALKGVGSGLQETSGAVGDVLGNSMDMRGGQSKKSDEAGKGIKEMGRSMERLSPALRSMPMIRLLTRRLERRIIWIWGLGSRLDFWMFFRRSMLEMMNL